MSLAAPRCPTASARGSAVLSVALCLAGCAAAPSPRPAFERPTAAVEAALSAGEAANAREEGAAIARAAVAVATATVSGAPTSDAGADAPANPATGDAPAAPPPSPAPARSLLLLGDSKIATDLGAALARELSSARPELTVHRRGKSATGLARPDFFDWMREAERLVAKHQPDVVVIAMGGNDGQALAARERGARPIAWQSAAWGPSYAARLTAFLDLLAGADRTVVWTEITTADRPRLEAKLRLIREIQRETVTTFGPRARYVETRAHFYDERGALVRRVDVERRSYALRQGDGIHFTVAGSRWLARRLAADLLTHLGVTAGEP